ncbi:MAG TPA: peptidoglycan DD-metalloendopeptidase family protein [Thermoanaerobaculia bacterium]
MLRWTTRPIVPARRGRLALHLLLAASAVALLASTRQLESRLRSPLPLGPTLRYDPVLAALARPGEAPLALDRAQVPQPFALRRGQTLAAILDELGLDRRDAHAAAAAARDHVDLRRLRAGDAGDAFLDDRGDLVRLRLGVSGKGTLDLVRRDGAWTSAWRESVVSVETRQIAGRLDGFLVTAIQDAGGDPAVAYKMSDVLQWDLDFNRDLRDGDRFAVLYEDVWVDGEPAGPGEVLALRYENRGRVYEAYRHGDDGGYYDAEGQPLRKMFLRSPLPFSRVTSRFSHRRFHPILKVHRPHYGVDYGAPTGTQVRVTAHGTVDFVGATKGSGKMVKVRHANGYLTAYLHLSRYASGLRRGQRVRQEEVIGYVGSTGLATAPHLDYRVQKNGRWIDPLTLPNVPAEPVPAAEMAAFLAHRDALRARLAGASRRSSPVFEAH